MIGKYVNKYLLRIRIQYHLEKIANGIFVCNLCWSTSNCMRKLNVIQMEQKMSYLNIDKSLYLPNRHDILLFN